MDRHHYLDYGVGRSASRGISLSTVGASARLYDVHVATLSLPCSNEWLGWRIKSTRNTWMVVKIHIVFCCPWVRVKNLASPCRRRVDSCPICSGSMVKTGSDRNVCRSRYTPSHECNPCWRNQSQFECFNHSPFSSTKGAIFYISLSHGTQRGGFGSTGDGRKSVVDSACFVDFAAFGRRFRTFILWTLRIAG